MSHFTRGFFSELDKLGFDVVTALKAAALPGAVGAILGGLSVYDLLTGSRIPSELSSEDIRGVTRKGQPQVTARPWIRAMMKEQPLQKDKVDIITTKAGIDRMMADKTFNVLQKKMLKNMAERIIESGSNAGVVKGEKFYVVVPKKAAARAVEHEVGHVREIASGRDVEPGFLKRLLSAVWKPTHEKVVMGPEKGAWTHARKRGTPLEQHALGTYEKGFHRRRAFLSGVPAISLLGSAIGAALEGGASGGGLS